MLDCSSLKVPKSLLNDEDYLKYFIADVLKASDMTAWGDPVLMRLREEDGHPKHLSGYSIVQLIHTSSLTVHICDETKQLYFDLFSCKPFKNEDIVIVLKNYFDPKSIKVSYLTRQA